MRLDEDEEAALLDELSKQTGGIEREEFEIQDSPPRIIFGGYYFTPTSLRGMAGAIDKAFGIAPASSPSSGPSTGSPGPAVLDALQECILALDRYAGPGTRGHAARKHGRDALRAIGVDVPNP